MRSNHYTMNVVKGAKEMHQLQSKTVILGPVRISYHNLLTPYAQMGNTENMKYTLTMLIPKSDPIMKNAIDAAIEATAHEGLRTKWNGSAPISLITPLHNGDGLRPNGEKYESECAGCYVMTANSKDKPELVDRTLQPIVETSEVYKGMWVYVAVNFFAYMRSGKKGIGCGLGPVMKFKDDEPLGGRLTAKMAFSEIAIPAILDDRNLPF